MSGVEFVFVDSEARTVVDGLSALSPDDERIPWVIAEARRLLAEGLIFPTDYVMLDGVRIAYVDASGALVPYAPFADTADTL